MFTKQKVRAAIESDLAKHALRFDAAQVVDRLSVGLTHSRDLLLSRIHDDVEQDVGVDSMIAPVSTRDEIRQLVAASLEIELYSCIVVADEVERGDYLPESATWFLERLFQLRMGDDHQELRKERVTYYRSESIENRRLKFLSMLQRAMPESSRTPLVLFRLFPRGVRIIAAVAFGDPLRAQELREQQRGFLPAIGDCFECHGQVLDNEETCRVCENPVWKYDWLRAE